MYLCVFFLFLTGLPLLFSYCWTQSFRLFCRPIIGPVPSSFWDSWCLQLTTWGGGSFSNSFMLLTLGFLHPRVVHEFLILPPKHRLQRARAGGPVPIKDGCVLDHLGRVRQVGWRTSVEPAHNFFQDFIPLWPPRKTKVSIQHSGSVNYEQWSNNTLVNC